MAPIRYSLHYEDYSEHLMSRFGKLLQIQSLVDMTLMCSSHTLRVHKAVLAASSAYFQEVLQKQNGEPLIILKMRFSVLKCLVEFMYCGKTQCLEENLDELVSAAQFLKIKGLSKVTKEGLGITNHSELPVFTPPVVINRPPQSLVDLHSQDKSSPQLAPATSSSQPGGDNTTRPNKDMVLRIPFDIDGGVDSYQDAPRVVKPRRGRPSARRGGGPWEPPGGPCPPAAAPHPPGVGGGGGGIGVGAPGGGGGGGGSGGGLGRAAERALLRREHDSRKAIHHLKHLQTRHMQDYMDRVTLSQAVNSICGPESSSDYMNNMHMDNDLMYMDQTVSSNVLAPPIPFSKEHTMTNETVTSTYSTNSSHDTSGGISNAMSEYVNALKNAGLPTDLPILFESGDGSYINVNEQVLLDMVQSSEIQYEVIEQPNIIEKVADPSEIKSIDDLSKSIEQGEMIMGGPTRYGKDSNRYSRDDAINSLNAILPDNLESFGERQNNFVVLDPRLQESNNMDSVNPNDFSCIDGDMQFFTKSMSDDVKKYYEEQQMNDAREMEEHLCPTSTTLDTNFNISMLDTKIPNLGQQYPLNGDDLKGNEDCYDFGLQLPQTGEDALDLMMATPKRDDDAQNEKRAQERDKIIQDLMNIEKNMAQSNSTVSDKTNFDPSVQDFNVDAVFNEENYIGDKHTNKNKDAEDLSEKITEDIPWEDMNIGPKGDGENDRSGLMLVENRVDDTNAPFQNSVIDLTDNKLNTKKSLGLIDGNTAEKENENSNMDCNDMDCQPDNDIPFAVGLLPLKYIQPTEENSLLKRRGSIDNLLDDAKCLKRKVKYKKL